MSWFNKCRFPNVIPLHLFIPQFHSTSGSPSISPSPTLPRRQHQWLTSDLVASPSDSLITDVKTGHFPVSRQRSSSSSNNNIINIDGNGPTSNHQPLPGTSTVLLLFYISFIIMYAKKNYLVELSCSQDLFFPSTYLKFCYFWGIRVHSMSYSKGVSYSTRHFFVRQHWSSFFLTWSSIFSWSKGIRWAEVMHRLRPPLSLSLTSLQK